MSLGYILNIINTILFSLAGLWGLILLFRNASIAWKWIALGAILWALTSILIIYIPAVGKTVIWHIRLIPAIQNIGMGVCLFLGLFNYHK